MAEPPFAAVLRHIRHVLDGKTDSEWTDGQLLERFVAHQDADAFAEIMRRHGLLVLGACRRLLPNPHDVEDAFQATFVVLVRRAASLRREGSVGTWLYGVAYRVALKARAQSARRRGRQEDVAMREENEPELIEETPGPVDQAVRGEIRAVLDEEVNRLPEKYRGALVLCDLEGKTNEEAARELGCPVGSMSWRLGQGRELLRQRLVGRGLNLAGLTVAAALASQKTAEAMPTSLATATLKAAVALAAGKPPTTLSATALVLADSVVRSFSLTRFKSVGALALAVGFLGSAGVLLTNRASNPEPPPERDVEPVWVREIEERIDQWQPRPEERRIDHIGWAQDIRQAQQLARDSKRPIFLFTHTGHIRTGRCGGSAFNLRANALAEDAVIDLLNRYFVPVYVDEQDFDRGGAATPQEREVHDQIIRDARAAALYVGSDCLFVVTHEGCPLATLQVHEAKQPGRLAGFLRDCAKCLEVEGGRPVVAPMPQSVPPIVGPDALVLHLTARVFGRKAWSEFPAENWLVLRADDCREFLPPAGPTDNRSWALPATLSARILCHFYPQTENNNPSRDTIEDQGLRATALPGTEGMGRVRLDGRLRMKHRFYPTRDDSNVVEATITGFVDYDPGTRRIRRLRLMTDSAAYGGYSFGVALRSLP